VLPIPHVPWSRSNSTDKELDRCESGTGAVADEKDLPVQKLKFNFLYLLFIEGHHRSQEAHLAWILKHEV
jgi:hypothetical protein